MLHSYEATVPEKLRTQRGLKDTEHKPLRRFYLGINRTTSDFRREDPSHKWQVKVRNTTDKYQGSCSVHLLLKLPFHQSVRVLLKEYQLYIWHTCLPLEGSIKPVWYLCTLFALWILLRPHKTVNTREKHGYPRVLDLHAMHNRSAILRMQVLINSTGIGNGLQLSRLILIEPPLQAFITKKAWPLANSPPAKVSKTPSSLQPVARWAGNIFANFQKNWNGVTGIIRNPRKDDLWKNLKSTIWWHSF